MATGNFPPFSLWLWTICGEGTQPSSVIFSPSPLVYYNLIFLLWARARPLRCKAAPTRPLACTRILQQVGRRRAAGRGGRGQARSNLTSSASRGGRRPGSRAQTLSSLGGFCSPFEARGKKGGGPRPWSCVCPPEPLPAIRPPPR